MKITNRDTHYNFYENEIIKKKGATPSLCITMLDDYFLEPEDIRELCSKCKDLVGSVKGKVTACMTSKHYEV